MGIKVRLVRKDGIIDLGGKVVVKYYDEKEERTKLTLGELTGICHNEYFITLHNGKEIRSGPESIESYDPNTNRFVYGDITIYTGDFISIEFISGRPVGAYFVSREPDSEFLKLKIGTYDYKVNIHDIRSIKAYDMKKIGVAGFGELHKNKGLFSPENRSFNIRQQKEEDAFWGISINPPPKWGSTLFFINFLIFR